ncbi:MAG TPA: HIT domain-containing protein [Chthoniobacteraceae bacterium]|jgi:diadenosine tetraphosphate (Ap4A) HIT family hydrolase|nr:HIT domain-containing protein [Chthoniobacteraceae bacterium]
MGLIADRVAQARAGTNPLVIARMASGWAVMGEVQFLPGYCLLLADPVVGSVNELSPAARAQYFEDMARLGDALLEVTDAHRINYEILCNVVPELHAHLFPRYETEPEEQRLKPAWDYDWHSAVKFDEQAHGPLMQAIRAQLQLTA